MRSMRVGLSTCLLVPAVLGGEEQGLENLEQFVIVSPNLDCRYLK